MLKLVAIFEAAVSCTIALTNVADMQTLSHPASVHTSQLTQLQSRGIFSLSKLITKPSGPANDNNKHLTIRETRNQSFLRVCMLKLGEMPVNDCKEKKVCLRKQQDS